MVSTGGAIAIAVVVLLLAAAIGWVVFTQLRARRLGLPPPTLSEYLPWKQRSSPYGAPRPAPGGIIGWFNTQVNKFKHRNNRSAAGAYEQPLQGGAQRRGFGPLDPDEAWDARVGVEPESYGYYEERGGGGGGGGAHERTDYSGAGGYSMNVASSFEPTRDDGDRGRTTSQAPGTGAGNPFDDDAEESLRGVSPRPMDNGNPRASVDTKRSVFREDV